MSHLAFTPPSKAASAFNCPHCGAYSAQVWGTMFMKGNGNLSHLGDAWMVSLCVHCRTPSIWHAASMVYPDTGQAPLPHTDLPDDIRHDYEEARAILGRSPRAAAALLRLAIQKLCIHLGQKGKDLNHDIGVLQRGGLLPSVQKALDAVRVIGNNAVHPGQIALRDDPRTVGALFSLVNMICEQMITGPRQAEEIFDMIPQGAKDGIAKRDSSSA